MKYCEKCGQPKWSGEMMGVGLFYCDECLVSIRVAESEAKMAAEEAEKKRVAKIIDEGVKAELAKMKKEK